MKSLILLLIVIFCLLGNCGAQSWKNQFVTFKDTGTANVRIANSLGYDYIHALNWFSSYYKNNPDCDGMGFYMINPEYAGHIFDSIPGWASLPAGSNDGEYIVTTYSYSQAQKDWYEERMVNVGTSGQSFPNDLAVLWFDGTSTERGVEWCFQQQSVITSVINRILSHVDTFVATGTFDFAGFTWDVPDLTSSFFNWLPGNSRTNLTSLTGTNSCFSGTHVHDYPDYSDGKAEFFKQLLTAARAKYGTDSIHWMLDPARIYDAGYSYDEWVARVKLRADKAQLTPDLLIQESADSTTITEFALNNNIFNAGMGITGTMTGIGQRSAPGESDNRLIASNAGAKGCWYNWYLNIGGLGSFPNFTTIESIYPRLLLIRCVSNWDNLCDVPLADRGIVAVNGTTTYYSPNSRITPDVMYTHFWKDENKIYACFTPATSASLLAGSVTMKLNERLLYVRAVNGYFEPTGYATNDFTISGQNVIPKATITGTNTGNPYIMTVLDMAGKNEQAIIEKDYLLPGSATMSGNGNASVTF